MGSEISLLWCLTITGMWPQIWPPNTNMLLQMTANLESYFLLVPASRFSQWNTDISYWHICQLSSSSKPQIPYHSCSEEPERLWSMEAGTDTSTPRESVKGSHKAKETEHPLIWSKLLITPRSWGEERHGVGRMAAALSGVCSPWER